jgi:hypothetical protein
MLPWQMRIWVCCFKSFVRHNSVALTMLLKCLIYYNLQVIFAVILSHSVMEHCFLWWNEDIADFDCWVASKADCWKGEPNFLYSFRHNFSLIWLHFWSLKSDMFNSRSDFMAIRPLWASGGCWEWPRFRTRLTSTFCASCMISALLRFQLRGLAGPKFW